jgi:murein DD-endopeptidase MepM/ murein hydrolase activator NlpD
VKRKPKIYQNITGKFTEFRIRQQLFLLLLIILIFIGNAPINGKDPGDQALGHQKSALGQLASMGWLDQLPPGTTVYYLKKGDTLYRLSQQYFVSLAELSAINHIRNPNRLAVNTKIYIPPVNYAIYNLQEYYPKPGDTWGRLCAMYNLELWQIKRLNPISGSFRIYQECPPGHAIFLPRSPLPGYRKPYDLDYQPARLRIIRPVSGKLSSRFGFRWGRMHSGIDLAAPVGTPVKAALAGKVAFTGWYGGYGLLVIINHGRVRTFYGHLSVILVKSGQKVKQGTLVGLVGATGRAYGSHLHFEVERDGRKINPLPYFSYTQDLY